METKIIDPQGNDVKLSGGTSEGSVFRFEIVSSGLIISSFTMALPPQSYSRKMRIRSGVQKTFRGTTLEVGRDDNENIDIKGSFTGKRLRAWIVGRDISGVEAYQSFKEQILYYSTDKRMLDRTVLSRTGIRFIDLDTEESQFVSINDFTIQRNANKPYWFDYSISLMTVDPPNSPMDAFDAVLKFLDDAKGVVKDVNKMFTSAFLFVDTYINKIDQALNTVGDIVDLSVGLVDIATTSLTRYTNKLTSYVELVKNAPENLAKRLNVTYENALNIIDACDELAASLTTAPEWPFLNSVLNTNTDIRNCALGIAAMTDFESRRTLDFVDVEEAAQQIQGDPAAMTLAPSTNGYTSAVSVRDYSVGSGDTLENISFKFYGSRDYAAFIAAFNELKVMYLEIGRHLRIPSIASAVTPYENTVLSRDLDRFGRDLLVENRSLQATSGGDVSVVTGTRALIQSFQARLSFTIGQLLSDSTYGFNGVTIGKKLTTEVLKLLKISMVGTLLSDGRIKEITEVVFVVDGSSITANITGRLQDDIVVTISTPIQTPSAIYGGLI